MKKNVGLTRTYQPLKFNYVPTVVTYRPTQFNFKPTKFNYVPTVINYRPTQFNFKPTTIQ